MPRAKETTRCLCESIRPRSAPLSFGPEHVLDVHICRPHEDCEPDACIEVDASDPAQFDCPQSRAW
jgi:hypothetical protein